MFEQTCFRLPSSNQSDLYGFHFVSVFTFLRRSFLSKMSLPFLCARMQGERRSLFSNLLLQQKDLMIEALTIPRAPTSADFVDQEIDSVTHGQRIEEDPQWTLDRF